MLYPLTESVREQIIQSLPSTVWGVLHCPDIERSDIQPTQYEYLIALCRRKKEALDFARELATEVNFRHHDCWPVCTVGHVSAGKEVGHGEYWALHNLDFGGHDGNLVMHLRDFDWQVEHFRVQRMNPWQVAYRMLHGQRCLQSPHCH